jgi:DNA-binding transcriptional MerR regulator
MTAEDDARRDQDELMRVMRDDTGLSIADIAEALGWRYRDGKPARSKVQRVLTALKRDGLMEKKRGIWMLTKRGRQAVQEPDGAEPPAKRRRAAVQTEFDLDRK